jgi:hypothetical protein
VRGGKQEAVEAGPMSAGVLLFYPFGAGFSKADWLKQVLIMLGFIERFMSLFLCPVFLMQRGAWRTLVWSLF